MELHQLRYAVEVHRRGSFTAAADALHISQSGISAQVAKLERELRVRLFDRSARSVELTAEGATLLPLISVALANIDDVARTADELLGLVRGSVRVGTIIGCTIPGYLKGFAAFRTEFPDVAVTASEDGSDRLLTALLAGDLDVALLAHDRPLPREVECYTIIDEPLAVGVSTGHEWADRSRIDLSELADANVLTLAVGTGIRSALERSCAAASVDLEPAVEAHSPETVLSLAERGAGVAVLSTSMLGDPLRVINVKDAPRAALSLAVRAQPGPAARAFADALRRHLPGPPAAVPNHRLGDGVSTRNKQPAL